MPSTFVVNHRGPTSRQKKSQLLYLFFTLRPFGTRFIHDRSNSTTCTRTHTHTHTLIGIE